MVSAAFKNRTRDEIIAAVRESIRKKHEWQERAEQEIKKIRQEDKQAGRIEKFSSSEEMFKSLGI